MRILETDKLAIAAPGDFFLNRLTHEKFIVPDGYFIPVFYSSDNIPHGWYSISSATKNEIEAIEKAYQIAKEFDLL
jgi:hypothetical protein